MVETPTPAITDLELQRINRRYAQLHTLEHGYTLAGLKFLFYSNAGGAIAMLSFIGISRLAASDWVVQWALISFVAGVILYGVSVLVLYFRVVTIHTGYRRDVDRRFDGSLSQADLHANDKRRSSETIVDYLAPFGSFFCFVDGCIMGGYALVVT